MKSYNSFRLFLSILLLFSCSDAVVFFEIQLQKAPALSFNKLITSPRNITESDILKQIPEKEEKRGFTIKNITISDSSFADIGYKSNFSLNLKKEGVFTATIVLEKDEYEDVIITDAEFEVIIKKRVKSLTFDTLTIAYKKSLDKDEILRQVQGEKNGYTLKSISNISHPDIAELTGVALDISLTLKKVGTFTATIVLENLRYKDVEITGAEFEIIKGATKVLTFTKLFTDKGIVTKDEILRQVQGEKNGYTLKDITISDTSFADIDISNFSLNFKKEGPFIATIVLEHPIYKDALITNAEFEKGENKFVFSPTNKAITKIKDKYSASFNAATTLVFPDKIQGIDVYRIGSKVYIPGIQNYFFGKRGNNTATKVILPKNLKIIGSSIFAEFSNLTAITLPASLVSIGHYTFSRSGLTTIEIPNSVEFIGKGAFAECSDLTTVTLSNNVTTIERLAFLNCINLTAITIPNSISVINPGIFNGCTKLVITIKQTDPTKITLNKEPGYSLAFDGVKEIKVPLSSLSAYKTATTWSRWASKIVGY